MLNMLGWNSTIAVSLFIRAKVKLTEDYDKGIPAVALAV